jgi:LmbE family N-acetylglucosaminyl deacetylase
MQPRVTPAVILPGKVSKATH